MNGGQCTDIRIAMSLPEQSSDETKMKFSQKVKFQNMVHCPIYVVSILIL